MLAAPWLSGGVPEIQRLAVGCVEVPEVAMVVVVARRPRAAETLQRVPIPDRAQRIDDARLEWVVGMEIAIGRAIGCGDSLGHVISAPNLVHLRVWRR